MPASRPSSSRMIPRTTMSVSFRIRPVGGAQLILPRLRPTNPDRPPVTGGFAPLDLGNRNHRPVTPGSGRMSESHSWSERADAADAPQAPPVAEQMRAATRSLRAHLSLVRDTTEERQTATGGAAGRRPSVYRTIGTQSVRVPGGRLVPTYQYACTACG